MNGKPKLCYWLVENSETDLLFWTQHSNKAAISCSVTQQLCLNDPLRMMWSYFLLVRCSGMNARSLNLQAWKSCNPAHLSGTHKETLLLCQEHSKGFLGTLANCANMSTSTFWP